MLLFFVYQTMVKKLFTTRTVRKWALTVSHLNNSDDFRSSTKKIILAQTERMSLVQPQTFLFIALKIGRV